MTTLIIILGYGKRQEVFDRHLPIWLKIGLPALVCSPGDDPLRVEKKTSQIIGSYDSGLTSFNGPKAVSRLRNILARFIILDYDYAVIFEYDSLFIGKRIEPKKGLHGIVQLNTDRRFIAPRYVSAPWMIDSESAQEMLRVAREYPAVTEMGADDRLISAWAHLANVPILNHPEGGFSRNTFTVADWDVLHQRVEKGEAWFHGIKDPTTLQVIQSVTK